MYGEKQPNGGYGGLWETVEGDRQEFEHFVEDMPKMATIFPVSEKLRH